MSGIDLDDVNATVSDGVTEIFSFNANRGVLPNPTYGKSRLEIAEKISQASKVT